MDKAGRVVVPRAIRKAAGLVSGPVDVAFVGAVVQIEVPTAPLAEQDGLLALSQGIGWSDEKLREFRLADRR